MEIQIKSPDGVKLLTSKKYCLEDIDVIPALQDKSVTPGSAPQTVTADTGYAALGTVTVTAVSTESGAATPSAAAQTVTPSEGKYFDSFTVAATPLDPASEVTAGTSDVDVTPSTGKIGLTSVTVHPTPTETKTITGNGTFTPTLGKYFSSVTVNVTEAKPEQEKAINLSTMAAVEVTPDTGYTLSKVTVTPISPLANTGDGTATAAEILEGYIAYSDGAKVTGTLKKQSKSVTPTTEEQFVTPDAGNLLSAVSVAAIKTQTSTVTPRVGKTTVTPDEGYYFTSVTVNPTPLDAAQTVTAGTTAKTISPSTGNIGLTSVTVNPTPSQTKSATPTTEEQTISPDLGKLLSSVTVTATPLDATRTVTAGTVAATVTPTKGNIGIAAVTVNPTPSSAKTATPTKASQVISPDAGKLLSSVTVNPIPEQYIIPSGTKSITTNGPADVTAFASVNVAVPAPDLSDATATAATMLSGYTAYTGAGLITGTIATYAGEIRDE